MPPMPSTPSMRHGPRRTPLRQIAAPSVREAGSSPASRDAIQSSGDTKACVLASALSSDASRAHTSGSVTSSAASAGVRSASDRSA